MSKHHIASAQSCAIPVLAQERETYEIHPVAEYFGFPMLEGEDWEQFVADIKKRGQLDPITLFEGKIADGRNRYKACRKLHIEPKVEAYEGKPEEIFDFVWSKNFVRRQLNQSQKAAAAAIRANASRGGQLQICESPLKGDSLKSTITMAQAAADAGVGLTAVEQCKRIRRENLEVFKAIQQGKISALAGEKIVKLPKEEQPQALQKAIGKGFRKANATKQSKSVQNGSELVQKASLKTDWTEAEVAREKECLAVINAASTYPEDAQLPKNDHHNAKGLCERIAWLRTQENKIANYKNKDLDEMQLATNYVQAYRTNWYKFPRPEGELDERIYDWAGDLWRKQQRQRDRLNIRADVRIRRKQEASEVTVKPKTTFKERFALFVLTIEDQFGRLFKPEEHRKLKVAFNKFVSEFWSESSTDQVSAAEVAAAQDVQSMDS